MSTHPRYDEAMRSGHWTPERCAKAFEKELHECETEVKRLKADLEASKTSHRADIDAWMSIEKERDAARQRAKLAEAELANLRLEWDAIKAGQLARTETDAARAALGGTNK